MGLLVRVGFGISNERRRGVDEAEALRAAFVLAARDLAALLERAGAGAADCLEFQLAMLDDSALIEPAFESIARGQAADQAWRRVMDDLIGQYGSDSSAYVEARSLDVADLRDRVLKALHGESEPSASPVGAIVVADDLPPSRFLEMDWSHGGAIALARGSVMSHTAILARAYGVPMIVQTGALPNAARALVDADAGFVELDPSEETWRAHSARAPGVDALRDTRSPAIFRGEKVTLLLNIEGPESLQHPSAEFADGIGLMRTEFLFCGRSETPGEDTQFEAYCNVLRWAGERPVTIRTLDGGGDKATLGIGEVGEVNPALGLRGLRLSLRRPDAFRTQLRALARAACFGNLKVMFPFVTAPSEFEAARAIFESVVVELKADGREARLPELGMMVEVPAAALTLSQFDAAFFSIGTNDLTQFVLACDRANGAVGDLYDSAHPAVMELVRRILDEGRARGRRVSLCGDVAADTSQTLALLNCGLREFSMRSNALACVRGVLLATSEARLDG